MTVRQRKASVIATLLLVAAVPATTHATLERVGPISPLPSVGSYPAWYQDSTGLTLEFCDPRNAAEVSGGWCLLLPPDVPVVPEVFPTSFFDEHFYFAAGATMTTAAGAKATLTLALEAAFAVGPPVPGDQVTFARIRVLLKPVPVSGTYTFFHPYGSESIFALAGQRIFFTDDVGIGAAGTFDGAMKSRLGPFLLASNTPGGAELPPVAGPSGVYIADPARVGAVTGSPVNQNFFRIVGPPGSNLGGAGNDVIETTNFTLQGRVFTQAIPGKVTVDRASYSIDGASAGPRLDVFATAFSTTQGRIPASPKPAAVTPVLAALFAPCGGTPDANGVPQPPYTAPAAGSPEVQMFNTGSSYWGQGLVPGALPAYVCVEDYTARNAAGQVVPAYFMAKVVDLVYTPNPPAYYDPSNGGTLTVTAASSDQTVLGGTVPVLTLGGFGPLSSGRITVSPLAGPPAKVIVNSSLGGSLELPVVTGVMSTPSASIPVAVNDEVQTNEDVPLTIDVLANDTIGGALIPSITPPPGATIAITGAPRLGTATIVSNKIQYTPFPNANGSEGIAYTVTANGSTSPVAYVTIAITPVNDAPVAVDDAIGTILGTTTFNLLANDTDVDGPADLASGLARAVIQTQPSTGLTVTAGANGAVTLNATRTGTYTFTYRAQDAAGVLSANTARATVTVASAESISAQAIFRLAKARWVITGTDSIHAGQTLTIKYDNGSAVGTTIGTAVVDAAGAWTYDVPGVTGVYDPRNVGATRVRVGSSLGPATTTATIQLK